MNVDRQVFYSVVPNGEIEELCLEFYNNFIYKSLERIEYPKEPNVIILEDFEYFHDCVRVVDNRLCINNTYRGYHLIMKSYLNKIPHKKIRVQSSTPLNLIFERTNMDVLFGGRVCLYELDVPFETLNIKQKRFWNWYQKSKKVFAMYYFYETNTCFVIKMPDVWEFKDNYSKMYYRFGNLERFFFGGVEVPKWLYVTPAEELNPKDYLFLSNEKVRVNFVKDYSLLNNADVRAEFIRKIGVDRLIEYGTVIDSYENYPDNEMWAKSEYKIIDMSKLGIPKIIRNGRIEEYQIFAPYLYMKNQTTGVYHLEGLHPHCKTLYDALKMRYNMLNIQNYEIKEIK